MGLDISIQTDKKEIKKDNLENFLSRTFLPLVFRQHDNNVDEILQITEITGVDLTPILKMSSYPDDLEEDALLEISETDEEKIEIKEMFKKDREQYAIEIDLIIRILLELENAIQVSPNYYQKLRITAPRVSLDYFKNYNIEPNSTVINYSFGIDIRNMLHYLQYAKGQGATKTWFSFG